jgi:hypothetical protein
MLGDSLNVSPADTMSAFYLLTGAAAIISHKRLGMRRDGMKLAFMRARRLSALILKTLILAPISSAAALLERRNYRMDNESWIRRDTGDWLNRREQYLECKRHCCHISSLPPWMLYSATPPDC